MAKAKKAGMATGIEVARITVKVSPDTRLFRKELKDQLQGINKAANKDAKIDFDADTDEVEKKVSSAKKRMSNGKVSLKVNAGSFEDSLAELDKLSKKKFDLGINPTSFEESLAQLKKLGDQGGIKLLDERDVDPKLLDMFSKKLGVINLKWDKTLSNWRAGGSLAKQMKHEFDAMNELVQQNWDLRELEESMRRVQEAVENIDKVEKVKWDFSNPKAIRYKIQELFGRLKVKVPVEADVDSGETEKSVSRIKGIFQKLFSKLSEVPSFGTGFNLTGYLVIATALAAVLAPLSGLLTSLLMALPGLMALILTPIGAITLGLEGMKEAASVLKEPFEDLKATMSAEVKDQFTPVFEKLGAVFPTLKAALPAVTQGVADLFKGFTDTVTSEAGLQSISTTIKNIGGALTAAEPGVASLTSALLKLTEGFSGEALSGLVTWFNGAMKSFDTFVTKLKESGQLDIIFQNLGAALKVVADVFGQIAGIGIETMLDPEAWGAFMVMLKGLGGLLVGAFHASKMFLDGMGNGIKLLGSLLSAGIAVAKSAWDAIKGIGSSLSSIWQSILDGAKGAWDAVVSTVQSAWDMIVSAVQTAISNVTAAVSALPGQIQGFFSGAGEWLVSAGKAIIQGLINGIKSMIGAVKDAVGSVMNAVKSLIPNSPAKEGPFSGQGWKDVHSGGAALAQQFGDGFESGFQGVLERAKSLATELKKSMDSGADGSLLLGDTTAADLRDLMDSIEQEKKRLKIIKNDATDKAEKQALQAQIDQLQAQKDILSYQRDRVKNEKDYTSTAEDDPFVKAASGLMNAPVDFAKATGKQFLTDLGISGDGMISKAITEGIQYIFQIGSVDEALSIKDREESKNAMSIVGRV